MLHQELGVERAGNDMDLLDRTGILEVDPCFERIGLVVELSQEGVEGLGWLERSTLNGSLVFMALECFSWKENALDFLTFFFLVSWTTTVVLSIMISRYV